MIGVPGRTFWLLLFALLLDFSQPAAAFNPASLAAGLFGGGVSGNLSGLVAAIFGGKKGEAEHNSITSRVLAAKTLNARNTVNTQNLNCRIATHNTLTPATEAAMRLNNLTTENGIIGLMFNQNYTPMRLSISHLYRLCQNGQLTPQVFGQKWFDDNECIDNPRTAYDYLKASTILDSPLLLAPTQAQMNILNNPEGSTPATVKATFDALNDKQKKFLGALRYCENLVIGRMLNNIRNGEAMTPANMMASTQNAQRNGALLAARKACGNEMARRTGTDITLLPASPYRDSFERNGPKLINYLVNKRGYDPRLVYTYATDADYDSNNPIGGAANPRIYVSNYLADQHLRAHAMDMDCVNYADTGTDAIKTSNALRCSQIALEFDQKELMKRKIFVDAVAAIGEGWGGSSASTTPIKDVSYEPGIGLGAEPLLQETSLHGVSERHAPLVVPKQSVMPLHQSASRQERPW